MQHQSTATTATRTTTRYRASREERGLQLFLDHASEVWRVEPHVYRVPSCRGDTVYLVTTKRGQEHCPCPDYQHRGHEGGRCKHIEAAMVYRSKSGECASCRGRYLRRELFEGPEGHEVFHEGHELCRECAGKHDVR